MGIKKQSKTKPHSVSIYDSDGYLWHDPPVESSGDSNEKRQQMLDKLNAALTLLPARSRVVLQGRFELCGQPKRLYREIAAELGIGRQRVKQIELRELAKLKTCLKSDSDGD